MSSTASTVGPLLRSWRTSRGKSQLALAVEAGVSTRHLSFVETGKVRAALVHILAAHEPHPALVVNRRYGRSSRPAANGTPKTSACSR